MIVITVLMSKSPAGRSSCPKAWRCRNMVTPKWVRFAIAAQASVRVSQSTMRVNRFSGTALRIKPAYQVAAVRGWGGWARSNAVRVVLRLP